MDKSNLIVYPSGLPHIDQTKFEVVERKGIGHPDTLCDTIAEKISRRYSTYCLQEYGVILRHMLDKIALSGGSSKVQFGSGDMINPIRLYLNCRFTRSWNGKKIPYLDIVNEVVAEHFSEVLPLLNQGSFLQIVDNTHFSPGPGVVYEPDGSTQNERQYFFEIPSKEYASHHDNSLRSNDTSTAVAYAPLSQTEQIVILVETTLNSSDFKKKHPYVGTDIKVMARRIDQRIDLTVCIPFIAQHTPCKQFYFDKLNDLKSLIEELIARIYDQFDIRVMLNTRDKPDKSDYYLTVTGSAIESGDEGVVGRGNRYNGVIPFTRRMSMEACCGKNPVYHVGKIYTAIASQISEEIYQALAIETYVYLTSQMGRDLSDPWSVCVETCGVSPTDTQEKMIQAIIDKHLSNTNETTQKIVKGDLNLF